MTEKKTGINLNSIKIYYFENKVYLEFDDNVEMLFLFFLYKKYIEYKGQHGKAYLIKTDSSLLIKKYRTPKLNSNITKIEDMVNAIYESSISDHRDSGSSFIGKISGIEIRFSKPLTKGIEIEKEFCEITAGYEGFKKKINIYI